jgi:hypothetical protein
MAYREFHYEKTYEAPDYSGFLDNATRSVSNLFQSIAAQNTQKQKNADQFNYDLSQGKFENDQKVLSEYANNVVGRGKQEILNNGKTSNETASMMNQGKSWQQMSQIQHEKAKSLQAEILARDTKDPYYDGQIDLGKLKVASNGENNEVNFLTRGDRLAETEKQIGGIDSFKYANYRADYVKNVGARSREATAGNPNATKTRYDEATFWDDLTGKPGVTDSRAIDYLNSDPQGRVNQFFDKKVNEQLESEIEKMKASGDTRTSWMKGLSKEEIKNELINDPSKNIINKQDFGVRKRELAKTDLRDADRINSKVSVDYKADKNQNGGMYKNPNIVHDYSFHNSKITAAIPGQSTSPYSNPGVGGVLIQKSGKPITFTSNTPIRTDVNTGKVNKQKIGSVPFNMTSYQLQAFNSGGTPVALHGDTPEQFVENIKKLPLEWFDPNGKFKLQPELKVALLGYTVNQANMLNGANNQEQTLLNQISEARANGDDDTAKALETSLQNIQGVRSLIGSGVDDYELAMASSKAGIRGVQINELIQASDADLANIRSITQGFDLTKPEYFSDDMQKAQQAYKERAQLAASSGYKSEKTKPTKKKSTTKPKTVVQGGFTYTLNETTGEYE